MGVGIFSRGLGLGLGVRVFSVSCDADHRDCLWSLTTTLLWKHVIKMWKHHRSGVMCTGVVVMCLHWGGGVGWVEWGDAQD